MCGRRGAEQEAGDLRVMVAGAVGEVGVDVHPVDARAVEQPAGDEDIVEQLRIALEQIAVALLRIEQGDLQDWSGWLSVSWVCAASK